ncbi:phosphoribosylamine--glycine ligase [Enterovirga sp.]|mgnify:CR=1 FL=1|uniref:phosphoribosylamine--glycine ligase n=1 Tax=Enterovirga sp. TaxID=2026350 RepID=UPI002B50E909|nr:phosphoribosylamine--glycine ligase [Enterovirga sp.]HMO28626.1 phosphoribosylamine--glycine ligase [Enterovirga sp.]
MNVLLIGSGGREHALAKALAASPLCDALFIAPGNPGTAACGTNLPLDIADHEAVAALCRREKIDFVVVGPEAPLVAGLVDDLEEQGFRCFGPRRTAAQLEGSKAFTREIGRDFGIPGAAFARFTEIEKAKAYLRERGAPIVIKADGLAAGKGVVVAATLAEAEAAAESMLGGGLGAAGAEILVEECLVGEEASVFALCDGIHAVLFGTAQDHKRAFDGDEGPNTGGMGAYSPAPLVTPALEEEIMARIIRPTLAGMRERGMPFLGILYAGLMLTAEGPKLIEYNVRFGDPEAEVLMPRLRSDLLSLMIAARDGALDTIRPSWSEEAALTVIMASRGYPGRVGRGSVIRGVEAAEALEGVSVYHAGTAQEGGELIAAGGRVLAVTATAPTIGEAQKRAYAGVAAIDWPEGFFRRDIGFRAIVRENA